MGCSFKKQVSQLIKGITTINIYQQILYKSGSRVAKSEGHNTNKIWVDKGSEFYNRSMKSRLQNICKIGAVKLTRNKLE